MKKICLVSLLVMMLVVLIACGDVASTTATTTEPPETVWVPPLPEGERVVKSNYTAVLNDVELKGEVDTLKFDLFGTGTDVYKTLTGTDYKGYTLTIVVDENGTEQSYTGMKVLEKMKTIAACGVKITKDTSAKAVTAKVTPIDVMAQASWKAVNAQAGTYIRFEFYTNLPFEYTVTVTEEEGGKYANAAYTHDDVKVTSDGEKYVGKGQATVPNDVGKTYYINICLKTAGYPTLVSIPLNIVASKYNVPYNLVFKGAWTELTDESYFEKFIDLFYNVYPRLNARWGGTGKEPQTVTLLARTDYDGLAYASGSTVGYSVQYLNGGPDKIGSLSHELTHSVQKYHYSYSTRGKLIPGHENVKKHYFTENMANYGRHRYWAYGYCTDFMEEKAPMNSLDWGYGEYGNAQLFWSWMDWTYPSKDLDGDGEVTTMEERGVIDYLVYMSKEWTGANIDDDPYTPGTTFNNWVKEKTGFNTFDLLRQEFVRQVKLSNEGKEGGWECLVQDENGNLKFVGFANFPDNFITEDVPGCPNPEYPQYGEAKPTAETHPVLAAAVTTGTNLCATAEIKKVASSATSDKYSANNLIDGDLTNRYQAAQSDRLYGWNKISNEIVIDLLELKTFDTYTLVSYSNSAAQIAKTWEILVSKDNTKYTAVDYQTDNTKATVSVTFDTVTARYVKIRLYQPDQNQMNITRLCEFMLFNSKE